MASASSGVSIVTTGTSVRNRRTNYYKSNVTTLADGSLKRETYRTDAQGNNGVKIQEVTVDKDGKVTTNTLDAASVEEKSFLSNPNSSLRQSIRNQTNNARDKLEPDENASSKSDTNKASGGSGNEETVDPNTNSPSAPAPQIDNSEPNQGTIFQGILKYPVDMRDDQDRISFQAVEIPKTTLGSSGSGLSFSSNKGDSDKWRPVGGGPVILPIQSSIKDNNKVKWGGDELDAIKFAGLNLFGDIANIDKSISSTLSGAASAAVETATANASEAVTALAAQAVGVKNLLSRTQGKILNPNLELLFNGPELRTFSFAFKLNPRSQEEANKVRTIIRYFKENSAVRGGATNLFLSSPYAFKIKYESGGQEHKSINKIKVCALTGFDVNYTPLNSYMTFDDEYKTMVSYELTMQFQEIIPILKGDYKELSQDVIGY